MAAGEEYAKTPKLWQKNYLDQCQLVGKINLLAEALTFPECCFWQW
jgi:hypothetical protein